MHAKLPARISKVAPECRQVPSDVLPAGHFLLSSIHLLLLFPVH